MDTQGIPNNNQISTLQARSQVEGGVERTWFKGPSLGLIRRPMLPPFPLRPPNMNHMQQMFMSQMMQVVQPLLDMIMQLVDKLMAQQKQPAPQTPETPVDGTPAPSDAPEIPAAGTPSESTEEVAQEPCKCPGTEDTKKTEKKTKYKSPDKVFGSGFLWKPVADKNGKLVLLFPPHLAGKIKSVEVLSPDQQKVLGRGIPSGLGNPSGPRNEPREHFRFTQPGGNYPENVILRVRLHDGTTQKAIVRNPAVRTEAR